MELLQPATWDTQVGGVTKRIRVVPYQLKLCRHLMPKSLRIRLIVVLVLPHLDCCAAFTDMTVEQDIRLGRAINACLRYVYGMR